MHDMVRKKKKKSRKAVWPLSAIAVLAAAALGVMYNHSAVGDMMVDAGNALKNTAFIPSVAGNTDTGGTLRGGDGADTAYDRLEYVLCPDNRREEIVVHTGYVVSHNSKWKIPNWVGYELTRRELYGTVPRSDDFAPDPEVKGHKAQLSDYKGSGYSRGHMAPAADMKWSKRAMTESFYLSNMCPQDQALNSGDWNELESKVRGWAKRDSAIIVVTGPIVSKRPATIGNKVAVPEAFYKVVLSPYGKRVEAIGFIMENRQQNLPLKNFAMTVDEVEKRTGLDFFHMLPDSVEDEAESRLDLGYWNLK